MAWFLCFVHKFCLNAETRPTKFLCKFLTSALRYPQAEAPHRSGPEMMPQLELYTNFTVSSKLIRLPVNSGNQLAGAACLQQNKQSISSLV